VKLSDYVARVVRNHAEHVFCVPGGNSMHLNDSLRDMAVYCITEHGAAVAAEAYARIKPLGVCVTTSGPGATNAITGCLAAWTDSTPVLFVSGQVKTKDFLASPALRQRGQQGADIVNMVAGITKYSVTVTEPYTIRTHLETAIRLAQSGRRGPVWIDIPLDVQAAEIDLDTIRTSRYSYNVKPSIPIGEIAEALYAAERPAILFGNGARGADCVGLAERVRAPVLTTRLGLDLYPEGFGMPGTLAARSSNWILQDCDLLLSIGARLDVGMMAHDPAHFAYKAKKIVVNIDKPELNRIAPDIPVCADSKDFIEVLLGELNGESLEWPAWMARCEGWRDAHPFPTGGWGAAAFARSLSDALLPDDVILTGNAGAACEMFLTAFKAKRGQRIFHNKGTGAMGFGPASALGAALASGRRVILIDGDGSYAMNEPEMATIRELNLPVEVYVLDNGGYAAIRQSQMQHFGRLSCDPAIWPAAGDVNIVDIDPDEKREPRVQAHVNKDGSITSGTLENMYPYLEEE
jgi:acetolactate synthase-1/2/3 large subunit